MTTKANRITLNEGFRLDVFRDPDEPKYWMVFLDHDIYMDQMLNDATNYRYPIKRIAIGTAVVDLLGTNPDWVPPELYGYIQYADPEVTPGRERVIAELMAKYPA